MFEHVSSRHGIRLVVSRCIAVNESRVPGTGHDQRNPHMKKDDRSDDSPKLYTLYFVIPHYHKEMKCE